MKKLKVMLNTFLILMCFKGIYIYASQHSIGIRAGIFYPLGDFTDYDTGENIEAFFCYMFNDNMAIEASMGYYQIKWWKWEACGYNTKRSAVPILATFKYYFPAGDKFKIYGGMGLGIHVIYIRYYGGGLESHISGSRSELGFHILSGLDYRLSDIFSTGLEIRYSSADDLDGISATLSFRYYI